MRQWIALLMLFITSQSYACPEIVGTWRSSELSNSFNDANPNVSQEWKSLLRQILGHIKIEIGQNSYREYLKETVPVVANGQNHNFEKFSFEVPYKVIHCDTKKVSIEYTHPREETPTVETFHFYSESVIWVELKRSYPAREYFTRVNQ